jgi:hypothetical protein
VKIKIPLILFYCLSVIFSQAFSQTTDESKVYKNYSINQFVEILKPFQIGDYAVGIQAKGKLANVLTNFGELSSFHLFTPSLNWPAFGEGQDDEQHYGWGVNLMMGYRGDVIESFKDPASDLISREWQPANENLFSGDVTVSETDLTPIMATSDNIDTWPIENGEPFWPGLFRKDASDSVYEGEFTSERDLYCVFDDNGNDTPYGLRVEQTAYSFSRSYAEDFLVYRFNIKNTSGATLDSLYPGMLIQFLIDFDNHDLIDFIDSNNDFRKDLIYMWDEDNEPREPWSKVGYIGLLVVKTPFNRGITDFHYFHDDFIPSKDQDYWMLLSSDTTGLPDTTRSKYFHGDNIHIDDVSFAAGLDPEGNNKGAEITWSIATGPVTLAADDSIQLEIAVVCGDDKQDLLDNVRWIWDLNTAAWNGPNPPTPPTLEAYAGDNKITVIWDAEAAEKSRDNVTGEEDFEGYKIYRSTDRGKNWGKKITDSRGNFIGFEPLAQFDLADDVTGNDPISNRYLGNDSGIRHTFVDSTVTNGLEYWYTVTAYDKGVPGQIESLESAFGLTSDEQNVVAATAAVIPGNLNPANVVGGDTLLTQAIVEGELFVQIIDPDKVKDRNYSISFRENTAIYEGDSLVDYRTTFTLKDANSDDTLLYNQDITDETGDNVHIVDGFRLMFSDVEPDIVSSEWTVVNNDTCGFYWNVNPVGANDYPVVYTSEDFKIVIDTTAAGGTMARWYDVWSGELPDSSRLASLPSPLPDSIITAITTTRVHLPFKVYLITDGSMIDVSDDVLLGEFYSSYFGLLSPLGWDIIPGGAGYAPNFPFPDRLILEYVDADSNFSGLRLVTQNGPPTASPPSHGDEFTIRTTKGFSHRVEYSFSTQAGQFVNNNKVDLKKIKVVPNPYFVTSAFDDRVMFTHLPNQCDIKIFTVAGDLVKTINHTDDLGIEYWDMKNDEGLEVAYGLYVYVVKTNDGKKHMGKFSVIR